MMEEQTRGGRVTRVGRGGMDGRGVGGGLVGEIGGYGVRLIFIDT